MGINPSPLRQSPQLPQDLNHAASTAVISEIGATAMVAAVNKRSLNTQIINSSRYLTCHSPSTIPKYQKHHYSRLAT